MCGPGSATDDSDECLICARAKYLLATAIGQLTEKKDVTCRMRVFKISTKAVFWFT